jgi:hypothetical protein
LSYDPSWRFPRRWFQVRKLDSVELTWKPLPSSSNYAWDIAYAEVLPRTEYALTPLGFQLKGVIREMARFGEALGRSS